jgi:TRAP transporter TAXI family solute receptor
MEPLNAETRRPLLLTSQRLRRWLLGVMALIFVGSIGWWYVTRDTLPRTITIAASRRGTLTHRFARQLARGIRAQTGRDVEVVETQGSGENEERLQKKEAHLAILQAGAGKMVGLSAIAPLYPEPVQFLVRQGSRIDSIADLPSHKVALGPVQSGSHALALKILKHYGVDAKSLVGSDLLFDPSDPSLDAAIITTGLQNPQVAAALKSGKFDLLPIEDPEALPVHVRYVTPYIIPRGAFKGNPSVPDRPVKTVATTTVLAARSEEGAALIRTALEALYRTDLLDEYPSVIPATEARSWPTIPLHGEARRYYDPYEGLDTLANFAESFSAGKEFLFALGAGIYVLWDRWKRIREREREREVRTAREKLDRYLNETVRIERAQMGAWDRKTLRDSLGEVTRVKLEALESLTHEDLHGDPLFLIFLTQCSSLIEKIHLKLELGESVGARRRADGPPLLGMIAVVAAMVITAAGRR